MKTKEIIKKIWQNAPSKVKRSTESAIVVSMAASILAAPAMDECEQACAKSAVQDMAHEISYTWDPFDGLLA